MRGVKDFLADSVPTMIDYIMVVSSPAKDSRMVKMSDRHERSNVVNALRVRAAGMPILYRESIPLPPHTLDIPRQLAVITTAVIRHSQAYFAEARPNPEDQDLQEFCARCFEVEEQAVLRVTQLAAQLSANQRRQYSPSPTPPLTGLPPSPSGRSGRPSTAPSDESSRRRLSETTYVTSEVPSSGPSSPTISTQPRNKLLHLKSISTDSIASHSAKDVPFFTRESSSSSVLISTTSRVESSIDVDDPKRKKGLLRGIWRR